jgi:hypothetical protein
MDQQKQKDIRASLACLTPKPEHLGLSGWSILEDTDQSDLISAAQAYIKNHSAKVKAAIKKIGGSEFLSLFLQPRIQDLPIADTQRLGFINMRKLPNIESVNKSLDLLCKELTPEEHMESSVDVVKKYIRIVIRENFRQSRTLRFIEVDYTSFSAEEVKQHFDAACDSSTDETELAFYEDQIDRKVMDMHTDHEHTERFITGTGRLPAVLVHAPITEANAREQAIGQLEQESIYPPRPAMDEAYERFVRSVFDPGNGDFRESEDVKRSLDSATIKAFGIYKKVFKDMSSLRSFLKNRFPEDSALKKEIDVSPRAEMGRLNFFDMLYAGQEGVRRLRREKEDCHFLEMKDQDVYLAQACAHLASRLYWLNQDPTYSASSSLKVNQSLVARQDRFWSDMSQHEDQEITYYTDADHRVIDSPTPESSVTEKLVRALNIKKCGLSCQYWRNDTGPKTDISTILKVLIKKLRPYQIPDLQRAEVVVKVSINDLDLNPALDVDRAEAHHCGLETLASEFCKNFGLKEAVSNEIDYKKHYGEIPVGTYVVVNKAEWNSADEHPPKTGFLAVKAYYKVAIDEDDNVIDDFDPNKWFVDTGEGEVNTSGKETACIVTNEIRFIPYDLAHKAEKDKSSSLHADFFKYVQACEFFVQTTPRAEMPELIDQINHMIKLAKQLYKEEMKEFFGYTSREEILDERIEKLKAELAAAEAERANLSTTSG